MNISIVIPVLNEEASLNELVRRIDEVANRTGYSMQIVFVDDGSTDRSWEHISQLAASSNRIEGIRFRRNFGKAAALTAGVEAANGDYIVTMDADLQGRSQ